MRKRKVQVVDPIVLEAIRKQVEFESLVEWAARPSVVDEEAMRREIHSPKKLGHAFPLQVLKFFQV